MSVFLSFFNLISEWIFEKTNFQNAEKSLILKEIALKLEFNRLEQLKNELNFTKSEVSQQKAELLSILEDLKVEEQLSSNRIMVQQEELLELVKMSRDIRQNKWTQLFSYANLMDFFFLCETESTTNFQFKNVEKMKYLLKKDFEKNLFSNPPVNEVKLLNLDYNLQQNYPANFRRFIRFSNLLSYNVDESFQKFININLCRDLNLCRLLLNPNHSIAWNMPCAYNWPDFVLVRKHEDLKQILFDFTIQTNDLKYFKKPTAVRTSIFQESLEQIKAILTDIENVKKKDPFVKKLKIHKISFFEQLLKDIELDNLKRIAQKNYKKPNFQNLCEIFDEENRVQKSKLLEKRKLFQQILEKEYPFSFQKVRGMVTDPEPDFQKE